MEHCKETEVGSSNGDTIAVRCRHSAAISAAGRFYNSFDLSYSLYVKIERWIEIFPQIPNSKLWSPYRKASLPLISGVT